MNNIHLQGHSDLEEGYEALYMAALLLHSVDINALVCFKCDILSLF